MDAAHPERTVLPSGADLSAVRRLLAPGPGVPSVRVTAGDESVELPEELRELLVGVVAALQDGRAVTASPHDRTLRTQEAADLLGVSRPTLVRLLEQGAIPYQQPCRHRRIQLADLLAYQDDRRHDREPVGESAKLGPRAHD